MTRATEQVRVFLVEQNPILRIGIATILTDSTVRLVGEAPDTDTCLERIEAASPDVVLQDLDAAGDSAPVAVRSLLEQRPGVRVIGTGTATAGCAELALAILVAGAHGYLLKNTEPAMLLDALRIVRGGGVVLSPGVGRGLPSLLKPITHTARALANPALSTLTAREYDVLRLIGHGYNNGHIARKLLLSDKTVRNYVSVILAKLGAGSRSEAIVTARTAGLVAAAG
ncbi:response regulator transcription factor [Streptomyces sp. NBC_01205]|uniref:response regulator transcription factor n=1 Tax=Streptomyces sp. NBC_01205 TaxID=2903771 RepID=UPI002E1451AF|nr:response regulator transcription factor [Streptomyces sp. NBC_01205]